MSYYRESPGKRSTISRSPVRGLESQRDFIEQEIRLKNAYRSEAENRRLLDEISILQIKTRKIDELEARCQALVKQNAILTSQNDQLAKQLSERRYEVEKIRSNTLQLQERDAIKSTQLGEINRSLQIEIELLKKERLQSNKLYEAHIQKLEIMLEDKIKESESLSLKCNDLLNEKEISQIKFEEEKNKLKNLMSRTSYDMERQLQYTKEKQTTEKFVEIENLKKNYSSQIVLLEDQISKLKAANAYRNTEFEAQLQQNKNLKIRYENQLKNLQNENDLLRERILKLEQMNKTEVENIQQKYSNIAVKGTTSLKEQHQRQIRLLLEQIDREKWIIAQKNAQIQHLISEKRDQQSSFKERQLALVTQVETLKNKLAVQEAESAQKIHELLNKVNDIHNKNLRDNENYFERVKNFQSKIKDLERQIDQKQSEHDTLKTNSTMRIQQLDSQLDEALSNLRKTTDALNDSKQRHNADLREYEEYRAASEAQRAKLSETISSLEVSLQNQKQQNESLNKDFSSNDDLLRLEIKSLRQTVIVLETKLSQEQQNHSNEMSELSANLRQKIERLQTTHNKLVQQLRTTQSNEIDTLRRRIEKLERQKEQMQAKLKEYIDLYNGLDKYFQEPHKEAVFKEKASSSIYEVLDKASTKTVHIF